MGTLQRAVYCIKIRIFLKKLVKIRKNSEISFTMASQSYIIFKRLKNRDCDEVISCLKF